MTVTAEAAQTRTDARERPLPAGWRWAEVSELCSSIDYGFTASANFSVVNPRFLRITDVQSGHVEWEKVPGCQITPEEESKYRLKDGDLVFARTGGTTGKSFLINNPPRSVFASYLIRLRPNEEVFPLYLYTFFQSDAYWNQVRRAARGGAQPNVNATLLGAIRLPLAPVPEQKRIAAILTAQLAAVEQARAAAEAQLAAARALPAAYLRAVFDSTEAQGWPQRRLGDVLTLRKQVIHPHDNLHGRATFVGLEHIESGTGQRIGALQVEMSELTGRKPQFHAGDIVYGYLRPYLNKVWVADFDGLCSVDQYVYAVNADRAYTHFIAWFMRSPVYLERAPIDTMPGQLPRIRTEEVAGVEVNLPALAEQRRVVASIAAKMDAGKQIRESVEAQLAAINELPAALLRQAFQGEI
jgi:type I restriction enzyme S subunit